MSHDHSHQIDSYNRAFSIGLILNLLLVIVEAGYGFFANSLALLADAGHNLSDVLSLLLAWGAHRLAATTATERRTYGFRKVTVIASLSSAILLLIALGAITWEAIGRFFEPAAAQGMTIIIVAAIGVVINTITALLFLSGQQHDLNIKAAFLHMAADAGVSLGVVIAGILILVYGWVWIDPVISLVIVAVVLISTWHLLRDSINHAIDAVPDHIDIAGIKAYFNDLDNVSEIHDLHVWPLSTSEVALTVHVVVTDEQLDNSFLHQLQQHLHDHFAIEHATIQVERQDTENNCLLDRQQCI